jgi:hypothetical protein
MHIRRQSAQGPHGKKINGLGVTIDTNITLAISFSFI